MFRRWSAVVLVFVCLLLLACGGIEVTSYVLNWNTSVPIEPDTVVITVVGGEVYGSSTNLRHTTGSVEVVAPAECVSVIWQAETKNGGTAYASYFWDRDCPGAFRARIFLPLLLQGGPSVRRP